MEMHPVLLLILDFREVLKAFKEKTPRGAKSSLHRVMVCVVHPGNDLELSTHGSQFHRKRKREAAQSVRSQTCGQIPTHLGSPSEFESSTAKLIKQSPLGLNTWRQCHKMVKV